MSIPDSVLDVDNSLLLSSGSLLDVIAAKQKINKPNRYDSSHCLEYFSDDPDFDLLMELATKGAIIDTDPLFVRHSIPDDFRRVEVELSQVF